jgi:hypothetical protein
MPFGLYRLGLSWLIRSQRGIFYFHPWEIDAEQPRVRATNRLSRFRHYVNIGKMPSRIDQLLREFAWGRMDRVFGHLLVDDASSRAGPAIPHAQEPALRGHAAVTAGGAA